MHVKQWRVCLDLDMWSCVDIFLMMNAQYSLWKNSHEKNVKYLYTAWQVTSPSQHSASQLPSQVPVPVVGQAVDPRPAAHPPGGLRPHPAGEDGVEMHGGPSDPNRVVYRGEKNLIVKYGPLPWHFPSGFVLLLFLACLQTSQLVLIGLLPFHGQGASGFFHWHEPMSRNCRSSP